MNRKKFYYCANSTCPSAWDCDRFSMKYYKKSISSSDVFILGIDIGSDKCSHYRDGIRGGMVEASRVRLEMAEAAAEAEAEAASNAD